MIAVPIWLALCWFGATVALAIMVNWLSSKLDEAAVTIETQERIIHDLGGLNTAQTQLLKEVRAAVLEAEA